MNPIDKFLNNFTMYRVVEYGLLILAAYSFILSLLGLLSYSPIELIVTFLTLTFVCYFGNIILGKIFRSPINVESSIITALILFFLLWPSVEPSSVLVAGICGLLAVISKFVISYKKKHIFNPAAFAAFLLFFLGSGAVWWVGTVLMLPAVLIIGLLIVRKVRKFTLFLTFLFVAFGFFLLQALIKGLSPIDQTVQFFTSFPVLFFGSIMLTEPLTMPPTRKLQIIYASLCGLLFSWQGSFGPIILTSELALLIGNVFSFTVSPKYKFYLKLSEMRKLATDTFEFSFKRPEHFIFKPGQYLEWTLPSTRTDGRGNRRYFTIASSPTEVEIKLGIRFNEPGSAFKKQIKGLKTTDVIAAGQLVGDFTLPEDKSKKLVFVAGGIGVTPFRSMIKYLIDKNEKRDIVFFYANKTEGEIAYKDIFDEAEQKLGVTIVYIISDEKNIPSSWKGEKGRITEVMLNKYVPDIAARTFYISGPNGMVENYKKLLARLKIKPTSIVTDYFPGF
jgi:ferredoxin-NADP reductase/Na+-translocating ferredoxin:NAD+ oxidoreductase RnfD subunit